MTVRIFKSYYYGASSMTVDGGLSAVLKQCLVDGFGSQTVTITRAGSVATILYPVAHRVDEPTIPITISGAVQTEYNGNFIATVVDATHVTITVAGAPATPATGTVNAKITPAGWTTEQTMGSNVLLKNAGSGNFFRIKDDGVQYIGQSGTNYGRAAVTGAVNYAPDMNTLISPFPRTIVGTDLHNNVWYGSPIEKLPYYIIIADEKSCYLLCSSAAMDGTMVLDPGNRSYSIAAFGDLKTFGVITGYPKSFVHSIDYGYTYYIGGGGLPRLGGYMEKPLTGGAQSTQFYVLSTFSGAPTYTVNGYDAAVGNRASIYPSPISGGPIFEAFVICDDTNNVVRVNRHSGYAFEKFATYPGLFASLHSTLPNSGSYQIGNVYDKVAVGGRNYMLVTSGFSPYASHLAIDTTGPW